MIKIMKKKSLLTGLFLIILLSITIITRIYYVSYLMSEVNINEDIYNAAKVSAGSSGLASVFADGFHIQLLYISNLYLAFLFFGNFTVAGVYLNILYQLLTVLLVYIVLRSVMNRYIGDAGSLILAILPPYISTVSEVTMQNFLICIVALISTIVILFIRGIHHIYTAKRNALDYERAADRRNITKEDSEAAELSTEPVMDTSMKEIRYDDLEDKKIQYIDNPLPVPKRKEHKEMDYAFHPSDNENDYDIKDLTGKDFYDIE